MERLKSTLHCTTELILKNTLYIKSLFLQTAVQSNAIEALRWRNNEKLGDFLELLGGIGGNGIADIIMSKQVGKQKGVRGKMKWNDVRESFSSASLVFIGGFSPHFIPAMVTEAIPLPILFSQKMG